MAALYARSRQWEEAIAIWEPLAAKGVIEAMERLAKYSEHVLRDAKTALRCAEALISSEPVNRAHERRLQRLYRKLLTITRAIPPTQSCVLSGYLSRSSAAFINWGSGAWSGSVERLRADGYDVWGFEPHKHASH